MAFMTLKLIVFENYKNIFGTFLPGLIIEKSHDTWHIICIQKNFKRIYFEGQNMALWLRQRFLARFNWIFVCGL